MKPTHPGHARPTAVGLIILCALNLTPPSLWAAELSAGAPATESEPSSELTIPVILERLEQLGPYEVPDLPLKTNSNYASSSSDVEPFGAVKPYKEHFLVQMEYTGAGRAVPEPEQLDSVKIGFLGPIMQTVSVATGGASHEEVLGIAMLRAFRLALEEANARGGYLKRRIPFELCVRNDNALWGASGSEVIHLAYKDNVWAIIGGIDGAKTHIAIRVSLKIEIPWMTPGDLDPTYIETNIPWVMRCIGDDRQQNYILVDGWAQPVYLCDRAVADEFLEIAGANANGVTCTYPWNPERADPKLDAFKTAFKQRWGVEPDTYAAHAYDGTNMLLWAIQTAGLNRAKIRDLLAYRTEPFPGVTGDIPLSSAMDDAGEVFLTRRENGRWHFYSRADLGIPRGQVIEQTRVESLSAVYRPAILHSLLLAFNPVACWLRFDRTRCRTFHPARAAVPQPPRSHPGLPRPFPRTHQLD